MLEITLRKAFYQMWLGSAAAAVILLSMILALASPLWAESDDATSAGCYCIGTVGNVNCDYRDQVTIGDVALLLDHLYISGVRLPNLQEANINGDPDGEITLGDVSWLLDHLFISGVALPDCPSPYNTPPETRILGFIEGLPFINSVEPSSPVAGVRLRWSGRDAVDHPYRDPEFEFEYRVYGPYSDSLLELATDNFVISVFRHNDGRMFRFGQGPTGFFEVCDTIWLPGGTREILCDTTYIDTIQSSNVYGTLDTLFDFEHPDFVGHPDLNRLAIISGNAGDAWITAERDSLYNLFASLPSDTTLQMNFIFTVRARETENPEAVDPTPAFATLSVFDPKHERDVLVMNWVGSAMENRALEPAIEAFWSGAIDSWATNNGLGEVIDFDFPRDLTHISDYSGSTQALGLALKYKIMINIQDACVSGGWAAQGGSFLDVVTAMLDGTNVWVAARVPVDNGYLGQDRSPPQIVVTSDLYWYFFGVDRYYFPGWSYPFYRGSDGYGYGLPRSEDFVGASASYPATWPDLSIDTAFLHSRYKWEGSIDPLVRPFQPFFPELGALPQVGWVEVSEEVEILYRYVSLYGEEEHPFDTARHYHDQPVMHRLEREDYRTVHSLFTPQALEETTGQQMVDSVLNWLYYRPPPGRVSDLPIGIAESLSKRGAR